MRRLLSYLFMALAFMFLAVPVFAALALIAVISIPANSIDHARARGAEPGEDAEQYRSASGFSVLHSSAARRLSCSLSSRARQTACSGPVSLSFASSATERKYSRYWRNLLSGIRALSSFSNLSPCSSPSTPTRGIATS